MDGYLKHIREKVDHMPIILVFAGGVLINDDKILLQHRKDRVGWSVFGGAMEYGETTIDVVKREYFEEIGIKVDIDSMLGIYDEQFDKYPNGDIAQPINIVYKVKTNDSLQHLKFDDIETSEVRWFTEHDLPEDIINDQHRKIIQDSFTKYGNRNA